MTATIDINQMQFSEKMALLEALWSDLSSDPDQIEVPQWHKDILDERQRAIENGTSEVLDLDVAKEQIKIN